MRPIYTCLHFIFLPRINQCIRDFTESWNHHPLSTKGNMTPYQLFYEGLLQTEEQQLLNTATVDTSQLEGEHVSVPRIKFIQCSILLQTMQSIDPVQPSNDNGKKLFTDVLHLTGQHLSSTCTQCSYIS